VRWEGKKISAECFGEHVTAGGLCGAEQNMSHSRDEEEVVFIIKFYVTLLNVILRGSLRMVVLGFELRASHLSHSSSPFLCWLFLRRCLANYLPELATNLHPPDLCLPSS
jgi:hypothetical protein